MLRGQGGGYLGVRSWKMSLNTLLIEGVMLVILLRGVAMVTMATDSFKRGRDFKRERWDSVYGAKLHII